MSNKLEAVYNPKDYEDRWYHFWTERGLFAAKNDSGKEPYVILMPPPNVTSKLHMGHGMGDTIQDLLIRWKRMQGFNACYLPGTDHAGIATQMMVEKSLEAEGKSRKELGREKFLERLWAWKEEHGGTIYRQLRKLGLACDWDRKAFTMDEPLSKAVRKIFVDLFEEGLIYRGERLVNWDPALKTAVSDDEVNSEEMTGKLWYFNYPLEDGSGQIQIATTRPETMLGDTAVAVHPDDDRYKPFIGKNIRLPLVGRLIPVVADDYVKSEFGTGAVKITPAHDANDFEIGKRHNLPFINIMNEDATLNENVPERFRGLDRLVARKEVIKALEEEGLFEKDEKHKNVVPHSDRSKAIIEPRLSHQWFVKMKALAEPAVEVAKKGDLKFYPDLWKKTYLHWLENIQDWCISRQLWWGHRIPIWYCADCDGVTTGMEDPTECSKCKSKNLRQDEDVLDTWFSSWLWPLSPFGWPEDTEDLKHFYPSAVLVTAPEIIFLWVARMVMVGLKTQGKSPFKDVYLTATVCDKQGRKFSKTLGNGIDPLELIDRHGADAVRFTSVYLAPLGGRVRMSNEDFEMGAKFINKLWNASRFLLSHVDEDQSLQPLKTAKLDIASRWLLQEFKNTCEMVNRHFEEYRINDGVDRIYHFIWGSFCDWGIESAKLTLNSDDKEAKAGTISALIYVLDGVLRLASPIMPFVTEEIWQKIPVHPDWQRPESLVIAQYPDGKMTPSFQKEHQDWQNVQSLIGGIRSLRSQYKIPPRDKLSVTVDPSKELLEVFQSTVSSIKQLAGLDNLNMAIGLARPEQSLVCVGRGYNAYLPAAGLVDFEEEKKRLKGEIDRLSKIVKGHEAKLGNPSFVDRAPPEVVEETKQKKQSMEEQLASLVTCLEALG